MRATLCVGAGHRPDGARQETVRRAAAGRPYTGVPPLSVGAGLCPRPMAPMRWTVRRTAAGRPYGSIPYKKAEPGHLPGLFAGMDYLYSSTRRVRCSYRSLAARPTGATAPAGPHSFHLLGGNESRRHQGFGPRAQNAWTAQSAAPPVAGPHEEAAKSKGPGRLPRALVHRTYLYSSTRRVRCSYRSLAASSFWAKSSLARSGKARVREE